MKEFIIIVALIGILLTPALSKAATAEELQAQTNVLIQQLIQALIQRIAELQQQIASILANQQTMIQNQVNQAVQLGQGAPALAPQEVQPVIVSEPIVPVQQVPIPPKLATLTVSSFLSSGTFDMGANQVLAKIVLQANDGSVKVKRIAFSLNSSNVQLANLFLTQDYYKNWDGGGTLSTDNNVIPNAPVFVLSSPFNVNMNYPITLYLKGDVVSGGTMIPFGVEQGGVTAVDAYTGDTVEITYLGSQ